MNVRTVLLLGKTGGGKSTLANVLMNRNNNFEEVFSESAGMTSETRQNQVEEFEVNLTENGNQRIRFIIVDTVGLCDTRMTEQGVLHKIAEMSNQVGNGLNQILFVTGGRFTREEIKSYNLLSQILFDYQVANYTTIVHTHFPEFEDEEACERDRQTLRNENRELFEIIRNARVMYVDNPPVNLSGSGTRLRRQIELNKEICEESRRRLLAHLINNCREVYLPNNLATLNERVANYQTEEEKMQAQVAELQQRIANQAASHQAQINAIQARHQQDLKDLEDKMKKDLANELAEKEKRIKEINDEAQKKMDKLQDKLDEANKQSANSAASAAEAARWEIVRSNASTSSALEKLEQEKEDSEKEQKKILELEKDNLNLRIFAYGQSVEHYTEKRVEKELRDEYEKKLDKKDQKIEELEQRPQVVQQGLLNVNLQNPNFYTKIG
ncbi:GTPase [endosymbiont GvMRE of Glomus versiforme]|uniref:GTPase n=1 Tax=endosymbiont GvMRE of Glomus versiforme TaxID=2039283 RepID=UPI000EE3A13A|nr:GTPase [endosymbiont GvMRE of Glomus versiforme]RHZ36915.1 GTPase IMAP family member 4-like isoform X1 [endosymbiont GvMRE of Glomus versiforme]